MARVVDIGRLESDRDVVRRASKEGLIAAIDSPLLSRSWVDHHH